MTIPRPMPRPTLRSRSCGGRGRRRPISRDGERVYVVVHPDRQGQAAAERFDELRVAPPQQVGELQTPLRESTTPDSPMPTPRTLERGTAARLRARRSPPRSRPPPPRGRHERRRSFDRCDDLGIEVADDGRQAVTAQLDADHVTAGRIDVEQDRRPAAVGRRGRDLDEDAALEQLADDGRHRRQR